MSTRRATTSPVTRTINHLTDPNTLIPTGSNSGMSQATVDGIKLMGFGLTLVVIGLVLLSQSRLPPPR